MLTLNLWYVLVPASIHGYGCVVNQGQILTWATSTNSSKKNIYDILIDITGTKRENKDREKKRPTNSHCEKRNVQSIVNRWSYLRNERFFEFIVNDKFKSIFIWGLTSNHIKETSKRNEKKRNETKIWCALAVCSAASVSSELVSIGMHVSASKESLFFLSTLAHSLHSFMHIRAYVRTYVNYFQHQNSKTSYSNIKESLKFKCVIAFLSPLEEILINWVITSNKMVKYMRMRRAFHYSAHSTVQMMIMDIISGKAFLKLALFPTTYMRWITKNSYMDHCFVSWNAKNEKKKRNITEC